MKIKTTLAFLLLSIFSRAQTYSGTGGVIQNTGVETYFSIAVTGLPTQLDSIFGLESVCININHPAVQELNIYLESPDGTTVKLSESSSCSGVNYTNTCFNNNAAASITLGTAPYNGSSRPIGSLGRFQNGQSGNGTWTLIVKDYLAFVNSGILINWNLTFGNSPAPCPTIYSSNLPIVIIDTDGQSISETEVLINMGIIYNGPGVRNSKTDPWNNYNGHALINIRGSSTKNFEKKAFSIETTDALGNSDTNSILGMPSESDWSLIAMYQDKSLLRVPLTYELSQRMGHYAARLKLVEVIMNNEYQGVYALTEKPKRDDNRIDVSKLTPFENLSPEITGGYIFKIDRSDEPGWTSYLPGDAAGTSHFYYQYVYPKDSLITTQQKNYIQTYMNDFEALMVSPTYTNAVGGYRSYLAVGSFIDYFIINELSKNVDAYRLSTFLYKENVSKGGKLHIGPVWDYDLAWHNCNYGNAFDPTGWEYQITSFDFPTPNWWNRFMQDTTFVNQLYCRWKDLRLGVLSIPNIYSYIDSTAAVLNESQNRNFRQWPTLGAYILPNPQNQVGASYAGEVADLKNWVANRIAWLDGAITGHCPAIGIDENNFDNSVMVYPNPFESVTTFEIRLAENARASLEILDPLGKQVAQPMNEYKLSGEYKIIFDREALSAGIYFYRLTINDKVKTGKMVIR